MEKIPFVYICPRCLLTEGEAGACSRCGGQRVKCCPGEPDDPGRRPIIDREGRVRARAPVWWLRHSVEELMRFLETK